MTIHILISRDCSSDNEHYDGCIRDVLLLFLSTSIIVYSLYCTIKLYINNKMIYEFYPLFAASISAIL